MKELSLQQSDKYIRDSFNKKIQQNLSQLVAQQNITDFISQAAQALKSVQDLNLVEADKLIASGLKRAINQGEKGSVASLLNSIANQPQIFRIHRDIIYTSMSRKERILAGITQQMRKGYCNKQFNGVYL